MDVDIKTRKVLLTREQIEKEQQSWALRSARILRVNPFI